MARPFDTSILPKRSSSSSMKSSDSHHSSNYHEQQSSTATNGTQPSSTVSTVVENHQTPQSANDTSIAYNSATESLSPENWVSDNSINSRSASELRLTSKPLYYKFTEFSLLITDITVIILYIFYIVTQILDYSSADETIVDELDVKLALKEYRIHRIISASIAAIFLIAQTVGLIGIYRHNAVILGVTCIFAFVDFRLHLDIPFYGVLWLSIPNVVLSVLYFTMIIIIKMSEKAKLNI